VSGSLLLLALFMQYRGCPSGGGPGPAPPPPYTRPAPPPSYPGPGDAPPPTTGSPNPEGPSTPGPDRSGPSRTGPSTPGLPGNPVTPGPGARAGAGGPRTGGSLDLGPELDWRDWWWLNGYDYFRPAPRKAQVTGSGDGAASPEDFLDAEVEAARESIRRGLQDEDDRVRAAAAISAGRVYEPSFRPALLGLLEDRDPLVRLSAIAGLGLAGSGDHVAVLMRIGVEGRSGAAKRHSLDERDLALLSLGLGVQRGSNPRYAPALRAFLSGASANERRSLGPSTASSLGLAGDDDAILRDLVAVARDGAAPAELRARALWSIGNARPFARELRPTVLECLKEKEPDVRRAAVLALGRLAIGAREQVLAILRSAVDAEGDTAVRAFALLAMGEVGGPEAKKELLDRVARGRHLLRPWAAIGMGILGRAGPDPEIGRALARAYAEEKSKDTRAAIALALGLARTGEARDLLRNAVTAGENGRERLFAAIAIALARDEGGREALRRGLREIPNPPTRAGIGLALSSFGNMEDLPALQQMFRSAEDPDAVGTAALALAWHGSAPALDALRREARTARSAERRAVSLLALGIGVAPERVPVSVAATGGWNYLASLEAAHTAARLWM
jgi:HEAT repeat protein